MKTTACLFTAFIILCLFAKRIYRKYELNIKVSLYTKGFTFVKEAILDHDKAFDAFISFSHKDDEFVIKEIISGNSKLLTFKLCIFLSLLFF